ncbi:MAG: ATP-binding cassette domain-containing protein [Limimaricola sp.]|uniref:sugar ABC transporter ATP-binding protein n=1 Tax=Limimaricola sp. TaxID=2211665 RepID=UPI001DD2443F|nr:sugar ABC transporter ATP-binding protein [Limimaricola sp.]MBI1418079.1 ATP-binding cassette domain-containing protein [Limimaricola sp.]
MNGSSGLFFDGIVKSFGGTQALRGVSLHVNRGEIVALLGENGAGKSTLIKVLGGIHTPDSGQVSVDGVPYNHVAGKVSQKQAVAFIHQDLGLIEWMSVAENIALAVGYARKRGMIDWRGTEEIARAALAHVEADFAPTTRVANLSRTEKSLVAIARALAVECDFLVLDEPTASLPADEVERLFAALRPLKAKGVGMIYVSHRLDEIFQIADRVAVLRDGQMVGMRDIAHTNPEDLVGLIVGHKAREIARPVAQAGTEVLSVADFHAGAAGPVDLSIQRGELVGLVGLRGAGHEDVGRALYGVAPHTGRVLLDGKVPDLTSPQGAMRSGIGFVARDRVVESVAPALTIRENMFLNPAASARKLLSLMSHGHEDRLAHGLGTRVGLAPNDPTLAIEALSGGNQQKIVVGRWLDTGRRFLIAEDPTAGVDVGAKAEIYHLLYGALASGMGVLVVSTDFEEVANICHRAIVFSRGRVVAELSGVGLSTESLIQAASAGEAA